MVRNDHAPSTSSARNARVYSQAIGIPDALLLPVGGQLTDVVANREDQVHLGRTEVLDGPGGLVAVGGSEELVGDDRISGKPLGSRREPEPGIARPRLTAGTRPLPDNDRGIVGWSIRRRPGYSNPCRTRVGRLFHITVWR